MCRSSSSPATKISKVGFRDVYGRMRWNDYSPTITGGCLNPSKGRFMHPEKNRAITAREAALLQTFPGNYKFPADISKTSIALIIGNALPPNSAAYSRPTSWITSRKRSKQQALSMEQRRFYADERLLAGCIYCGGATESRDHVPSASSSTSPTRKTCRSFPRASPAIGDTLSTNSISLVSSSAHGQGP